MPTVNRKPTRLSDYQPTPYLLTDIYLNMKIDASATEVSSRLMLRQNAAAGLKAVPLVLDGEDLDLVSVQLDGRSLRPDEYNYSSNRLVIHSPPGSDFTLEIVNRCNPSTNTALSGLYVSNGIFCTQCEAEGFRRITFAYDRPDALARYTVRIEADKGPCPVLLSNGNLKQCGLVEGGSRHFAVWEDPHPKPSYLFALVAGDLAVVRDEFVTLTGRHVDLAIYVEHGKENRCAFAMGALKASMAWDERRFGREYDLDTFNILAISDFNMGAMENKGLNIFSDKYILALPETATDQDYVNIESIIGHEYFHNWTGNRITCRDWFQLCLKEGLTVFRDQEFTSDLRSRAVTRIDDVQTLRARQFPEDAGPLAHPPRPSSYIEINNFYTPTVYEKGAEICRMLQTLLGETAFRSAMDLYFERYDGHAATVEEFVACFADASGRDLSQFFRWYEQAGTPVVTVTTAHDATTGTFTVTLSQLTHATPDQPDKLPQHIPFRIGLLDADGNDLPLNLKGKGVLNDAIIELCEESQSYSFTGLQKRPALSLNRGFSAPVIIKSDQTASERLFLMSHDSDSFNRWESGQTEATSLLVATARAFERGETLPDWRPFAQALSHCLSDDQLEDAFRAKLMALPTEPMIAAALASDVDTDIVAAARRHVLAQTGLGISALLRRIWSRTAEQGIYEPSPADIGRRSLRYVALSYITASDQAEGQRLIGEELASPRHMTGEFGALAAALQLAPIEAEAALAGFYERHHGDQLLVDKWYSLMAAIPGPGSAARVSRLVNDANFKLTTPNRVYALVGSFTTNNMSGFNSADGAGYRIVADTIVRLDPINPQVAARMATSFRSWRMMNRPRREAAEQQLKRIVAQPNLSRDSFEIASKILGL